MRKINLLVLSLLFVSSVVLLSKKCLADENLAESKGFSIQPFFQEINVQKDQDRVPFSVDVKNNTAVVMVFRVSVIDFGTLDESGGVAFLGSANNLKYGLASWVNLQNDTLVINPGETATVKGNIENKDSLSPGGHYGAIFLKTEDDAAAMTKDKNVAFDSSFASLLFVRKIGGEIYGLNLNRNEFSNNFFSLPDFAKLLFQNPGNVHVTPRGIAKIIDPVGTVVQSGIINEQSLIILPETFRLFPTKMTEVAKAFIPGRYTLKIDYRFDGKDDFTTESSSFVYVPLLFVVGLTFFVAVLIFAIYFWLKKKKK